MLPHHLTVQRLLFLVQNLHAHRQSVRLAIDAVSAVHSTCKEMNSVSGMDKRVARTMIMGLKALDDIDTKYESAGTSGLRIPADVTGAPVPWMSLLRTFMVERDGQNWTFPWLGMSGRRVGERCDIAALSNSHTQATSSDTVERCAFMLGENRYDNDLAYIPPYQSPSAGPASLALNARSIIMGGEFPQYEKSDSSGPVRSSCTENSYLARYLRKVINVCQEIAEDLDERTTVIVTHMHRLNVSTTGN